MTPVARRPAAKVSIVKARIDPDLKARAEGTLNDMGLTVSAALRLMLQRVAEDKELPFSVRVPNATTIAAMRDGEEGRVYPVASAVALLDDPDEDD